MCLFNGMWEKDEAEQHSEQVQFAAFKQFCDSATVEKKCAIKETGETIVVSKAGTNKLYTWRVLQCEPVTTTQNR